MSMRFLYVGDMIWWGTCLQRCNAIRDLGHEVSALDMFQDVDPARQVSMTARIARKFGLPLDYAGVNARIIEEMKLRQYDVLWIDKGLLIKKSTLHEVKRLQPGCKIAGYSPDDMYQRHNQSRYFLEHLTCYDIFFTTKSYGVGELRALGCPQVVFVGNSYDPATHRKVELAAGDREKFGGEIGFIGAWEAERARSILALAKAGLSVRVWGSGWENIREKCPGLVLENRYLLGDDYARGMCSFDINLCFLRKINRDLQTTRSIEIPACGAFMLAENSPEHEELFVPGVEAVFFSSDGDLVDKARYYLAHPGERLRIAAAGKQRCIAGGYSNQERMKAMLSKIFE